MNLRQDKPGGFLGSPSLGIVHWALVILVLLAGVLAGCPAARKEATLSPPAGPPLVWPEPPERARIRHLAVLKGPRDMGIEPSLLGRLFEILAGKPEEWLIRPSAVVERDGLVAVADPGAQALVLMDTREGRFTRVTRAGEEELSSPVGVAIGPGGAVYVSDSSLGTVFAFDRRGRFLRRLGDGQLQRPASLIWNEGTGRLYVADAGAHQIATFDADGQRVGAFGRRGTGPGEFNFPTHLSVDRRGMIYVTDALNYRIQIFQRDGQFAGGFGRQGDGSGDLAAPKGIGVDGQGHIYVVDALFDAVQIFDRQGRLLLIFGNRGLAPGQFWLPGGLFIDEKDRIYVADSYNQRIQLFQFLGGDSSDQ